MGILIKVFFENQKLILGNWEGGERNGIGLYFWKTGEEYEGEWKNDQMNGRGILKKKGKVYNVRFEKGVLKEKKTIST